MCPFRAPTFGIIVTSISTAYPVKISILEILQSTTINRYTLLGPDSYIPLYQGGGDWIFCRGKKRAIPRTGSMSVPFYITGMDGDSTLVYVAEKLDEQTL